MSELKGDYRKFMDKNYLGSWDVPDDEDLILTIDHCEQNDVQNERGTEKKLVLYFKEPYKPMILNTVNSESISEAHGSKKVENWKGKRIAIYTEKVKAFGSMKDALRIRAYPPKETTAFCDNCGSKIEPHGSYSVNKIVTMSKAKYGQSLCWECASAKKEASE